MLPDYLKELQLPSHDWQQALDQATAEHDERPTWAYNWPAGKRLCHDLPNLCAFKQKRVCDLGCGRGLLGLAALCLGAAHVHFCDGSAHVLNYVSSCLHANGFEARSSTQEHQWGTAIDQAGYDYILGGDILYRPECFDDLCRSISQALSPDGTALLSDPRQQIEEELSTIAIAQGLEIEQNRRKSYTLINFRCKKE